MFMACQTISMVLKKASVLYELAYVSVVCIHNFSIVFLTLLINIICCN